MNVLLRPPCGPLSLRRRIPWIGSAVLAGLLAVGRAHAATVTWDGGGDGVSWTDARNWSGDALPGSTDTAVLNVAAEPTVTLAGPLLAVAALDCRENLVLAGAGLKVTGACVFRDHRVQLDAGTLDAATVEVRNGTLELGNGSATGDVTLYSGRLAFLPTAPIAAGRFHLRGIGTFEGNVPAGTTVVLEGTAVEGLSRWTAAGAWSNGGIIRLVSLSNDFADRGAYLTAEGSLDNLPGARIEVAAGAGDPRVFAGILRNQGTVAVEAGITLNLRGAGGAVPRFTLSTGEVNVAGDLIVEGGRIVVEGGSVSGPVRGLNSEFDIGPDVAGPLTVRAIGNACRLLGNASPNATLWAEGNIPWGLANVTVSGEVTNRGTLRLEASSNDFADRGAYLQVLEGARLLNAAGARITAVLGAGDGRTITGTVLNEGRIEALSGAVLEFRGRLESAGGTYAGDVRFVASQLLFPAAPEVPTELFLVGPSNQLLSDIPANTTVRVSGNTGYGLSRLTVPRGVGIDGVLRLSCESNDFADRGAYVLVSEGVLTNRAAGRIEALAATGDGRVITGNLLNEGTLAVETGINLTVNGTGQTFRQTGGSLAADGEFLLEGGRFELSGGTLSGVIRVHDATVATEATAVVPAVVRLVGAENQLDHHAAEAATLWLEGNVYQGYSRLRVPVSTFSRGTLRLEASSNDFGDRGSYLAIAPGAILTNEPSGRVVSAVGAGDGRSVTGRLWHRGRIQVESGTTLDVAGRLDLDGGSVEGDLRVFDSEIATHASAAAPSVIPLYATGNRLVSDVASGYALWIRGTAAQGLARLTAPTGFTNHGILRLECTQNDFADRGSYLVVTEGTLTIAPGGRLESLVGAGDPRVIDAAMVNEGTVQVTTATTLGRSHAAHRNPGTLLVEAGTLVLVGDSFDLEPSGVLGGAGTLDAGAIAFLPRGTIRPGSSPGALTFRGAYTEQAGTRLELEAAGTTPGTQLDQWIVNGPARLGGRLRLSLADGYLPVLGDVLPVVGFASVSGVFSDLQLPALEGDLAWLAEFTPTQFRLKAVSRADASNQSPAIVVQPAPLTVVKGRTATFTVTANGSPPLAFQWQRDEVDLPGATGPVLTLPSVQPEQQGKYRVILANSSGTLPSVAVQLQVLPSVGTLVPVSAAALPFVPGIAGDGVEVKVYNGIGGGPAPTFAMLDGLAPTGSTPSPVIDFPHPGSTVGVGTSFDTFFADTTTPPASLSAVAARNFVLDHEFFLRVERADDLYPDTPEIDVDLGVGSDDGFRLRVGGTDLGAAGDRGFAYTWFTVSFAGEGLYPVRLLFSANATGQSGLELSRRTALAGQEIVPQRALYRSTLLGDRLVTFDTLAPDTRVADQYLAEGLRMTTVAGDPRVTAERPTRLVPVSPPQVFGDPSEPAATPFVVDLTFVTPDSGAPGATEFFSFFAIDAEAGGLRVEAFDAAGTRIHDREFHGGAASREQGVITAPQIARVRFTQLDPADAVAVDHLGFATPVVLNHPPVLAALDDVALDEGGTVAFRASATDADPGQTLRFLLRAGGPAAARIDPATGAFSWTTTEADGPGEYPVTVVVTDDGQPAQSDEQTIVVRVREGNTAPRLAAVPPQWISADGPLRLYLDASDADLPAQALRFALATGAPAGMHLDAVTGELTWTIDRTTLPGVVNVTVEVTDDGTPPLSARQSFPITVDHAGPVVLAMTPSGAANLPVRQIDVRFDRPVLASTVSLADFVLAGPSGTIACDRVDAIAADTIRLRFPEQRANGDYALAVGPDIRGPNRAPMNQDGDAINGEDGQDVFHGAFRLALPDLVVTRLDVPAAGAPGETVAVVWGVANRGTAPALPPWFEALRLSTDATPGNDAAVADFRITNALPAGGGILRTQLVTLPVSGAAGALRFVVVADANGSVAEESEDNNARVADAPTEVAPGLGLQLARTDVPEGAPAFQAILRRNGPVTEPLEVALSASPAGQIDLPARVTLPAGQSSSAFQLAARSDGVVDGDAAVTVFARAAGYRDGTAALWVRDIDVPRLRVALAGPRVAEGATLSGTVTRDPVTPGSLTVHLASGNPAQLRVTADVVIPDGAASAPFEATPVDDRDVERPATFAVTATAGGFAEGTTTVEVTDNDAPELELAVSPASFAEGAGPTAAIATLTRRPPGTQALRVALSSSRPNDVVVPASVTFPAEASSVTFPVSAVDNALVDGSRIVTLAVDWIDAPTGQPFAVATQAAVTVTDDDAPALAVRIERDAVAEGLAPATTARIRGNRDTAAPVTVTLASSDPGELTVPASVVLPAGNAEVIVPLNSIDDGIADGSKTVTLTASAPGYVSGSDQVVVPDVNLPDLVFERLAGPVSGETDAPFQATFREVNRGLAPATGTWRQELFLSDDPFPGNDRLLGSTTFTGSLGAGLYSERTLQFRLPSVPGSYWLVAVTDPDNAVAELVEGNNTLVATTPIVVSAAYTAVVSTDVTTAPAGTAVPFSGRATRAGGSQPAAFEPVNIHVRRGDTRRVIAALTDADGRFAATFTPLPGEAGVYQVGAAHPGIAEAPVQDTFTLLGMQFEPRAASIALAGPGVSSGGFELRNLSSVPLDGLAVSVTGLPDWLDVAATVPPNLPGDGVVTVAYTTTNRRETSGFAEAWVEVRANGGLLARLPVSVRVQPLVPRLVAVPDRLEAGMLRGEQTLLSLRVRNDGGAPSGPWSVLPPDFAWFAVASAQPLPSLAPGAEAEVTFRLSPPADLPLGRHEGSMVLSAAGAATRVPFSFLALSDAAGSLVLEVVDEFTYYAAGAPRVAGAAATAVDELTGVPAAAGQTDAQGRVTFAGLREGYYRIRVTAVGHAPAEQVLLVPAGQPTERTVFVSRNTVEYRWTVTPTEIEDRTRITVEAVFEAVVPAPVVVVEPSVIDFADFAAEVSQVDLKVTNHGLIAANDVELSLPELPGWKLEPLVANLGTLPARSSFTIPVVVRRLAVPGRAATPAGVAPRAESIGCRAAALLYKLVCGPFDNTYRIPIGLANDGSGCPVGGGGGGTFVAPKSVTFDSKCGPGPCAAEIGKWAFDCALGILPIPDWISCGKGVYDCISATVSGGPTESTALTCVGTAVDCAQALGKSVNPFFNAALDVLSCADGMRPVAECLEKARKEKEGRAAGLAGWGGYDLPDNLLAQFSVVEERLLAIERHLAVHKALIGNPAWFHRGMDESFSTWLLAFRRATGPGTPLGTRIDPDERAALVAGPLPPGITAADANRLIDRWNRSASYYAAGIFNRADLPPDANPDFIALDELLAASKVTRDAIGATEATGFSDPVAALKGAVTQWKAAIGASGLVHFAAVSGSASALSARGAAPAASEAAGGICARVRLRLDQEAVMSRDAFEARLEVENRQDTPLRDVRIDLVVRDAAGTPATGRFGIHSPRITGFGAIDGTGNLPAQTTGTVAWTLVPSSEAAPTGPVSYVVAGTLRYVDEGLEVTLPLAPVTIDVLPVASLAVKYFHQRDVLADDPFTDDVVEPSIPYALGVLVQNRGAGEARNVRIASAQPRIVENEKGLLVDFRIIGTEVDGQGLSPSLTVDLGTLAPGASAVGRWLLRSTLQGQFVDYAASFEHLDGLGDPRLSLVESVEIHELIRIVDAGDADPRADFLANDLADDAFLPDTLHLSGGGIEPVAPVTTAAVDGVPGPGRLEVALTGEMPAGWVYVRVPDPSGGTLVLRGVRRPDGTPVPTANFWTTDRTFPAGSRRPVYEHNVHFLDRRAPGLAGAYTLVYAPAPPADTQPPASSVAGLPTDSHPRIPVAWSGTDGAGGSGIAAYDIYVATDLGPFVPWLRGTTGTAATFVGEPGHAYAFYSVATDVAGNREAAPDGPDAFTTASQTNRPPVLVAPAAVSVEEGALVQIDLAAHDPDEPFDRLTFALGADAPPGVVLDPVTGRLSWKTSEDHGPGIHRIPVEVRDDGIPPLVAAAAIDVTVAEVNSPPELQPIADARIDEGKAFAFAAVATDPDRPANNLRFRLLGTPPPGASIDAVTGLFSWSPGPDQGGRDYAIGIEVSDDGQPARVAVRYFTVVVNDLFPDFTLAVGRTWVRSGGTARIPILLGSGIALPAISLELVLEGGPYPQPSVAPIAPQLTEASLVAVEPGRFRLTFAADPLRPLTGQFPLGELLFQTAPDAPSAHVRIRAESVRGQRPNGDDPARGHATHGRLVVVGTQPVLEIGYEGAVPVFRLFAEPGHAYGIERQALFAPGEGWETMRTVVPESVESVLGDLPAAGFYRATLDQTAPPVLAAIRRPDRSLAVVVTGPSHGSWILEQADAVTPLAVWTRAAAVDLTHGAWTHTIASDTGAIPMQWYRLRRISSP